MNQQAEKLSRSDSPRALLFGATGSIGKSVCKLLLSGGWTVVAVTRQQVPEPFAGVEWRYGALPDITIVDEYFDAIISCGPLDLFSHWYVQTEVTCNCIVAFSSTSVHIKQLSPEHSERDLAGRLQQAEARLMAAPNKKTMAVTILRPTLVYGTGMDRNISRIASLAYRYGFFILPHDAVGLRQPVHVDDLATTAIVALSRTGAAVCSYDLPGGETLTYREMTTRILSGLQPPVGLLIVPGIFFRIVASVARIFRLHDAGDAVLARMRENLVFDDSAARADLGYSPRPFTLDTNMLNVR